MTNPRKEIFNNLADTWDDYLNLSEENIRTINCILDNSDIRDNDRILDVGSGTGVLIPYLLERLGDWGSIVCIDMAEKMIRRARSKYPDSRVSFIADDVLKHSFEPEEFDQIFIFSAFQHFEDKKSTIKVLREFLKPGGYLTISHVESSEVLNNFHKNLLTAILSTDYLPSIDEMLDLIDTTQWKVAEAKDQHKLYNFRLKKI